jgi:N utilization substance protein A
MSDEAIKQTIEDMIKAAYKKTFGHNENCIVKFKDDFSGIDVYSRKVIVDGVYDPSTEIEIEEAKALSDECELGDELDVEIDPHTFARSAVTQGKQTARQALNENFKDSLYKEYDRRRGEVISGFFQREKNQNIFVEIERAGDGVEAVLPKRYQSPRETYEKGDKIKAVVVDVKKIPNGIQLVLSRTDPKLVQNLLSIEVTEIVDGTVSIYKVVREAGYRTKIAVYSNRSDVDPIGACVGPKGVRIQNVIKQLDGEKIDVLPYVDDPRVFIATALQPAEVKKVYIRDFDKKEALAIVNEKDVSLAIGKGGMNVSLANRLCDWNIDVKTEEQVSELDLADANGSLKAAEDLFRSVEEEEVVSVSELPGIDERIASLLKAAGYDDIQRFSDAAADGSIKSVEGLSEEDIALVSKVISENVVFADEEPEEGEPSGEDKDGQEAQAESAQEEVADDEDEYTCPECGAKISLSMTKCPKCGVEFSFVEE